MLPINKLDAPDGIYSPMRSDHTLPGAWDPPSYAKHSLKNLEAPKFSGAKQLASPSSLLNRRHLRSVQFSSFIQSCPTLCDPINHSTPGLPVHHQPLESPKPMSIESVMPSNHLILYSPLLLLPSIFPSIRVFSDESALCIRWPKYWSFSFNIVPPVNTQDLSPLGWTGWMALQSKGLSRVFSNTTVQKHQLFGTQLSSQSNSHIPT